MVLSGVPFVFDMLLDVAIRFPFGVALSCLGLFSALGFYDVVVFSRCTCMALLFVRVAMFSGRVGRRFSLWVCALRLVPCDSGWVAFSSGVVFCDFLSFAWWGVRGFVFFY